MTDLDELRAELRAAVAPPYEIRPVSGLGPVLRGRARRRRLAQYAAGLAAAVVCVAAAVTVTTHTDGPARPAPPAKSDDSKTALPFSVRSGPRTLGARVEVHEAVGTPPCGTVEGALESADGGSCFQVDPPELVVRQVADLAATVDRGDEGAADDRVVLVLTLDPEQQLRYRELITPAVGRYAVHVVGGLVYTSPALGDEKPDGRLRLTATDDDAVERLAQVLAGPSTPATN